MRVIHISTWALRIHLFVDKNNAIRLDPQMFYKDYKYIPNQLQIFGLAENRARQLQRADQFPECSV